jgi:nucleoside-diphosphate-sugar epimerase
VNRVRQAAPARRQKVLITGGAGYIGSRLARRLAADGAFAVTVLDNLRRGSIEALNGDALAGAAPIRFVEGDVRDPGMLNELSGSVDTVFHLAAESAVMAAAADPEYCFETNVAGTFRVLQAARANGVRRVVFTSSREVYGDPLSLPVAETAQLSPKNAYGASKAAAEMCCGAFVREGPEIAIVRLSNVYGPGDKGRVIPRFVDNAILGLPLTVFGGEQVLDFVWIETVLDSLMRIAFGRYVPEVLNIGSGRGVMIVELCERIVRAANSSSKVGLAAPRETEVVRFVADVSAAREAIGLLAPADPLFGLEEVIAAVREPVLAG